MSSDEKQVRVRNLYVAALWIQMGAVHLNTVRLPGGKHEVVLDTTCVNLAGLAHQLRHAADLLELEGLDSYYKTALRSVEGHYHTLKRGIGRRNHGSQEDQHDS